MEFIAKPVTARAIIAQHANPFRLGYTGKQVH